MRRRGWGSSSSGSSDLTLPDGLAASGALASSRQYARHHPAHLACGAGARGEAIVQCVRDHGFEVLGIGFMGHSPIFDHVGEGPRNHDATRFLFNLSREVMGVIRTRMYERALLDGRQQQVPAQSPRSSRSSDPRRERVGSNNISLARRYIKQRS